MVCIAHSATQVVRSYPAMNHVNIGGRVGGAQVAAALETANLRRMLFKCAGTGGTHLVALCLDLTSPLPAARFS
jgi:hypothetical protein